MDTFKCENCGNDVVVGSGYCDHCNTFYPSADYLDDIQEEVVEEIKPEISETLFCDECGVQINVDDAQCPNCKAQFAPEIIPTMEDDEEYGSDDDLYHSEPLEKDSSLFGRILIIALFVLFVFFILVDSSWSIGDQIKLLLLILVVVFILLVGSSFILPRRKTDQVESAGTKVPSERLVTLYEKLNPTEAGFIKERLETEGIYVILVGLNVTGIVPIFAIKVDLKVQAKDYEKAKKVLSGDEAYIERG